MRNQTIGTGHAHWSIPAMVACVMFMTAASSAGPIFPLPPGSHPPGFVVHVVTGIGVLPPGGFLPPIAYGDALPSPDLHHLEIEINNPNPFPMLFTVTYLVPGGPFAADVGLLPGMSILLDMHYLDVPEVGPVGTWLLTAASAPGTPGPVTVDGMVVEYPIGFPPALPGFGPPIFSAPGGFFGPATGLPGITFGVPAPGAIALLGLSGLLLGRRRR